MCFSGQPARAQLLQLPKRTLHIVRRSPAQALLAAGGSPNCPAAGGQAPLHLAARWGHAAAVRLLVSAGAKVQASDDTGASPLHLAAQHGHAEAARDLLAAGAKHSCRNNEGERPLHMAAAAGFPALVALLCEAGAEAEAADNAGSTALHAAVRGWQECSAERHAAAVRALLERHADPLALNCRQAAGRPACGWGDGWRCGRGGACGCLNGR